MITQLAYSRALDCSCPSFVIGWRFVQMVLGLSNSTRELEALVASLLCPYENSLNLLFPAGGIEHGGTHLQGSQLSKRFALSEHASGMPAPRSL